MTVSAIIVTRGDVDLAPIRESLDPVFGEVIVWNNGTGWAEQWKPPWSPRLRHRVDDLAVYGRYAAIEHASGDLIYVQDDDCVLPPESIQALVECWRVSSWARQDYIVANMPPEFRHDFYSDHCLLGFGAVFHRDLPARAFRRFYEGHNALEVNDLITGETPEYMPEGFLLRTCDVVFTALTPRVLVDVLYENLPWADGPDRMWRQPEHVEERAKMLDLVRKVRDAA